ncbi:MAG TPA: type IV toxin-antitoxin system AbiEi family antitoxin domain-containing protein [Streptosporangiaceae bacterium]|nr:type IV toxin-antitoxin system AbiEi family antitoxin domain-containing protein [Streptosporangiaceae bacterium]
MSRRVPQSCQDIAQLQGGVISRRQALIGGMPPDVIDWRLRGGWWQPVHRGVYATFTGELPRTAILWAAMLRAGTGAALSHQTAAELFKLRDRPSQLIHVTIPRSRRVEAIAGVVIHRSDRLSRLVHPTLQPQRVRLEETVLDLVHQATKFDTAFNVACVACQRGLTRPEILVQAMADRPKLRWRKELAQGLGDIGAGVHSLLEYRYLHSVERPHGLPAAVRQARVVADSRQRYLDNLYQDYLLCVELDGRQAHPDEQRRQDMQRMNAITQQGITTLRYCWADVDRRPCQTAAQIASLLHRLGWQGQPRQCGPACPVTPSPATPLPAR